jgi:hypothetical protein
MFTITVTFYVIAFLFALTMFFMKFSGLSAGPQLIFTGITKIAAFFEMLWAVYQILKMFNLIN